MSWLHYYYLKKKTGFSVRNEKCHQGKKPREIMTYLVLLLPELDAVRVLLFSPIPRVVLRSGISTCILASDPTHREFIIVPTGVWVFLI